MAIRRIVETFRPNRFNKRIKRIIVRCLRVCYCNYCGEKDNAITWLIVWWWRRWWRTRIKRWWRINRSRFLKWSGYYFDTDCSYILLIHHYPAKTVDNDIYIKLWFYTHWLVEQYKTLQTWQTTSFSAGEQHYLLIAWPKPLKIQVNAATGICWPSTSKTVHLRHLVGVPRSLPSSVLHEILRPCAYDEKGRCNWKDQDTRFSHNGCFVRIKELDIPRTKYQVFPLHK